MLVVYAVTAVFVLNCDFLANGNQLTRVPPTLTQIHVMVTNYSGITGSVWRGLEDIAKKSLTTHFFMSDQSSISVNVTAPSLSTDWKITGNHSETTASSATESPDHFSSNPSSKGSSSIEQSVPFDTSQATWTSFTAVPPTTSNYNSKSSVNPTIVNPQTIESSPAATHNKITSGSTLSDNTTYPTTSMLTSPNSTIGTTPLQPTIEISTFLTTPETTPTTTPPPCECESMKLDLGDTEVGSNWFAIPFNSTTSSPMCVDNNLTGLNVTLYGPFDKEEFPAELQTCSPSISCLSGINNSFFFNSTLCCKRNIVVRQCSDYTFTMIPKYTSCVGQPQPVNTSIFTLPGPDAAPKKVKVLQTGSDWVVISWQDLKFCEKTITSYLMRFDLFYPDGGSNSQMIRVPLECTNRSFVDETTVFDSRTCLELLTLEVCSIYSVVIEVELFGMYRSQSSQNATFNTEPPDYLLTHINEPVHSGSDWLAFIWYLSERQCQMATTGFQFNLTNVRGNSSELYQCNATVQNALDSEFLFNTSSADCDRRIIVPSCSDYQFSITPKIFDTQYNEYGNKSLGRTTCETIEPFFLSIKAGSDWISFNWTTSVQDCREVLTGFWLSIAPSTLKSRKDDSLQFISMADCYCNLKNNEPIMFNTSFSCSNTWTSPGIFPCSQYEIYLIPQFFGSLNGSANSIVITETLPGDQLTPVTQNVEAGKHWISFEYQASTETCRKSVTGLWITMDSIPSKRTAISRDLQYFCPAETTGDTFISFNTSSNCSHEQILSPCNYYTFEIQLDINGRIGRPSNVNRTTTPGYDATALIDAQDSGTNWISFEWQSSVRECQKFITAYQLNVTDVFMDVSQSKNLSRSCSLYPLVIGFNSSLPCAGLEISPCSNYLISLVPQFHIGDLIITGISAITEIGSKSGKWGEIEQPMVAAQSTNSLTLTWIEPVCRSTANLVYYNVTVMPNWNLRTRVEQTFLKIKPECLDKIPSGQVSVTLNETVCNRGYKFVSCAPYLIKVLPVYQLSSANENLRGWQNDTQTLPMQNEASVNNLIVQEVDTRWMTVSWPIPTCRLPISSWNLTELKAGISVVLPSDCPTYVSATHLTLNISDSILCRNNVSIDFPVPFIPCTNYQLGMYVTYSNLDVQPGTNNIVSATTEIEPPGIVSNFTWNGTTSGIYLNWDVPKKNPQCVEGYRVVWNNQETFTTETYAIRNSLRPCTRILASVYALPNSIPELHESAFVSTETVDPAPVDSGVSVTIEDNGRKRNVSWLKPEIDDCITGYKVNIKKATSMELVYNKTIPWKNLTWVSLNDGFEQEFLYDISIATYSNFKGEFYVSNATSHVFTWDSASSMINTTSLICGIIFSILALAMLYGAVLLRKSHVTILSPSFTLDKDKQSFVGKSLRTLNGRKHILVHELKQTIEWLEADSSYELSKEFESMRSMSSHKAACSVANLPENLAKNRYCDILPYDHTRVKLRTVQGAPPQSDYINASYIKGYAGKRVYIATQGPKPSTIEDFWLMCFEQDATLIVALTLLEERGRVKCAQYWPSTTSCYYGNMYVELIHETQESYYTIRDFLVTQVLNGGRSAPKFVRQMHYTEWPDFGCPENPEELINFIHAMRAESTLLYNTYKIACPIIVHCSAGVGRTGTLIALDILMEQARQKKIIDVLNTVLRLRGDRDRMVQTEEQYHFLYKCIESYCRNELQLKDQLSPNSTENQWPSSIAFAPLSFFQKDPSVAFSAV